MQSNKAWHRNTVTDSIDLVGCL